MKNKKRITGIVVTLLVIISLVACAKKSSEGYSNNKMTDRTTSSPAEAKYDSKNSSNDSGEWFTQAMPAETQESNDMEAMPGAGASKESITPLDVSDEKIIRKVYMRIETLEFDDFISNVNSSVEFLGGYIESADINGKSIYGYNDTRSAEMIVRIPRTKLNKFMEQVEGSANVTSKSESTENVTLQYVDTESRKKALEIEQERLFSILEKTETLQDIFTLESRLSSIRYELQNFESKIRTIDNQVDFSTVTMNINEVERITPVKEKKLSMWEEIRQQYSENIYEFKEGLKEFFVGFVVNLPYIIIWAIVLVIAIIVCKRLYRKFMKSDNTPNVKTEEKSGD